MEVLSDPDQSVSNASSEPPVLRADGVGFSVDAPGGRLTILHDISLSLNSGQTLAIVGASGSGKTTLLGLLAGLEQPTTGSIELAGTALNALNEDQRAAQRRAQVGFVFQSFHLLPSMNALENVMLALEIAELDRVQERALSALEQVGLSHRLDHYPRQLSGGEQQRVAIARAFAANPNILFADEPTGNLDRDNGSAIADLLFGLNEQHGTALILVTHDLKLAKRCQRIVTMDGGELSEPNP
ncbi:MAG: ATP-binding cassette domain-containing protein [Pseudomonadota bacterium]